MRMCVREEDGVLACAYVSVIDLILFFSDVVYYVCAAMYFAK